MIRKYKDSLLGDTTLSKDKNHKKTVIVKEKIISSQEEFDDEIRTCEMLFKLNNIPTFTKLDGYSYKAQTTNNGESCLFFEIREYLENDLEKEVASRLKTKEYFTEGELWKMAHRLISAFAKLQYFNVSHSNIRPKNILISKDGEYKIHWTNYHPSTYEQLLVQTLFLEAKCVLSPELLDSFFKQNPKPDYNPLFSDVFSFGLTLLYAGTLGDIDDIYDWHQMVLRPQKLNFKLSWLKATYSDRLYKLLEKMLQFEPVKRSDFQSLVEYINHTSYSKEHYSLVEMSSFNLSKSNSVPQLLQENLNLNSSRTSNSFKKPTYESETVFEPITTKGGSPRSPLAFAQIRETSRPFSERISNANQTIKLQRQGSIGKPIGNVIKEEEEGQDEVKMQSPILLKRAFSPLKKESKHI